MYGNALFYAKIIKTKNSSEAVFLNPEDGKIESIKLAGKYTGKMRSYERMFRAFKILLNIDDLDKIKRAVTFYNTDKGFFFACPSRKNVKCPAADEAASLNCGFSGYYISVARNYLIRSITSVGNGKMLEIVRFKDYVLKGAFGRRSMVPLKIYVDDYLYNVKINIALSKGSRLIKKGDM